MKGYQADIDAANQHGPDLRGTRLGFRRCAARSRVTGGGVVQVIGTLQRSADEIKTLIKPSDWNQVHLIARGNTIIQILNGQVRASSSTTTRRAGVGGLIGFQMHVGPPMKVEFRNVWLKTL
jgi:hypothetical protein